MIVGEHIVTAKEQHIRLDKLLTNLIHDVSRSELQKSISERLITVNGTSVKSNYKCRQNDRIQWRIPEKEAILLEPEHIPLDIIYEDNDLLVVNKPKGVVVHPTEQTTKGTLVHALLAHCKTLSTIGGANRPGIVHRIDKDTSGLLVVAKNNEAHTHLKDQLMSKSLTRVYETIVHGILEHKSGVIDAPIARDPNHRLRMAVVDHGKRAITHFKVLHVFKNHSYVECQLETGRTHQIRVHMKYINHPIVGDTKYGLKNDIVDSQLLVAKRISFLHPKQNKRLQFEIESPTYFQQILQNLEK